MRRGIVVGFVALVAVTVGAKALAHGGLEAARPAPGATVGGDLDDVVLVFAEPVASVSIALSGPDEEPVPSAGAAEVDGAFVRQGFTGTAVSGWYRVDYRVSFEDGNEAASSFVFRYDPAAPAPPELEPPAGRVPWFPLGAGLATAGAVVLISRRRRRRTG